MDVELVIRAQEGDQAAFERLAAACIDRLHGLAYSVLGDAHGAEDATQQALLGIWRDLPKLREPERFEAWSYRLLVRACYAEARRTPRWLPDIAVGRDGGPRAQDDTALVVDRDELERGFRRLPVDQRAVVVLHYLMDLPLERVADVLGIPLGTAHSRLNRALQGLRAALAADARTMAPGQAPTEGVR
jgi:RNA polymerase sigma-70 factor (ECF subfamily)